MNTPLQHERRSRQRFDFQLPVSLRVSGTDQQESAFTQDLSARGAMLYTDCLVEAGAAVELTLMMPSEITLTKNMRVRCRGKVLRVIQRDAVKNKVGLAVELVSYEYLSEKPEETDSHSDFDRVLPLHENPFVEEGSSASSRRD